MTNSKGYMHPIFIVALFTIAMIWKQPKCPSTDEWIKKMIDTYICTYIHTHTYVLSTHTHTHPRILYSLKKK